MGLVLTPGAPPIFLSAPLVNKSADAAGQIVATSMQALVHRVYQLDPTAPWVGSLGASDAVTEQITMGLYSGSMQIASAVDSVIVLNHNLNNFLIEYCTNYVPGVGGAAGTGTWQTLANVVGQGGADYYAPLAVPIANVNGVRLTMYSTSPANQQKQVANLIVALSTFQMSVPPSKLRPSYRQGRVDVQLADISQDTSYFLWSDNSFTMTDHEIEIDFANVYSANDKANFDALFFQPSPFLIYPEPGDNKRGIFLCVFDPKSYTPGYSSQWKNGGRKIPFKTRMVGYL
jgi:hypothetical protein